MQSLVHHKAWMSVFTFLLFLAASGIATAAKKGISAQDMARLDEVRKLYHENCAMCHGEDGAPLVPGTPDFSKGEGLNKNDAELLKIIKEGKDVMPPWKDVLNEQKRKDVLSYVRAIAGDQVFQEKCNRCHGLTVPALSDTIPKTRKALLDYKGPLNICREKVESTMTRKEIIDVITLLRTLPK